MVKHILLFEICTRAICEMFVYKHSETIEYVKKNFKKKATLWPLSMDGVQLPQG